MLNIPETQSLSWIRSNILLKQVHNNVQLNEKDRRIRELEIQLDQLKNENEESKQELQEFIDSFGNNEKMIYVLEAKVQYYESVIEKQRESNEAKLFLSYTEQEFYPEEIKDVVLELLDKSVNGAGESGKKRRAYHVLQDIKKCNNISEYRREMKQAVKGHNRIIRGNPVRIYEGMEFNSKK